MRSTFHVSFQHDLIIDSNTPRTLEDAERGVYVQINRFTPQPAPEGEPSRMTSDRDFTCVFSAALKPSEARTIASALMTAAQSVR